MVHFLRTGVLMAVLLSFVVCALGDDITPVQLDDGIAARAEAQATLSEKEAETAKEAELKAEQAARDVKDATDRASNAAVESKKHLEAMLADEGKMKEKLAKIQEIANSAGVLANVD